MPSCTRCTSHAVCTRSSMVRSTLRWNPLTNGMSERKRQQSCLYVHCGGHCAHQRPLGARREKRRCGSAGGRCHISKKDGQTNELWLCGVHRHPMLHMTRPPCVRHHHTTHHTPDCARTSRSKGGQWRVKYGISQSRRLRPTRFRFASPGDDYVKHVGALRGRAIPTAPATHQDMPMRRVSASGRFGANDG